MRAAGVTSSRSATSRSSGSSSTSTRTTGARTPSATPGCRSRPSTSAGLRRVPDDLTEAEQRVAELAATGLENREVAAQLFMSPKTVEANHARAYRKLGIRSRAELGARLTHPRGGPAQT